MQHVVSTSRRRLYWDLWTRVPVVFVTVLFLVSRSVCSQLFGHLRRSDFRRSRLNICSYHLRRRMGAVRLRSALSDSFFGSSGFLFLRPQKPKKVQKSVSKAGALSQKRALFGAALGLANQARIGRTTWPLTSVRRKSRPEWRNVSRSWSRPSKCKIVACRSWIWTGFSTTWKPRSSVAP